MGVPAVQTIFLAATVFFKYAMQLNMAPATGLAMIVATVYMVFIYPRAWKVIINTLPRDINLYCLLTIRELKRVKSDETGETASILPVSIMPVAGGHQAGDVVGVVSVVGEDDEDGRERFLQMVRSPEVRFPCGQAWYLVTFLAGVAALVSTPAGPVFQSLASAYPLLYASWVTSGVGMPCLAAEFFFSYGWPRCARAFLIGLAPPLIFYQAPKYFSLVDQYNDALVVCSLYTLALLAVFVGDACLLFGCFALFSAVVGVGVEKFPKRDSHFVLLSAANLLFLRALQKTL